MSWKSSWVSLTATLTYPASRNCAHVYYTREHPYKQPIVAEARLRTEPDDNGRPFNLFFAISRAEDKKTCNLEMEYSEVKSNVEVTLPTNKKPIVLKEDLFVHVQVNGSFHNSPMLSSNKKKNKHCLFM